MTEPQIRDLLAFAEAERAQAIELAGEFAELAGLALHCGATALSVRLTRAAQSYASKIELIDRLVGSNEGDDEDTIPIIVRTGETPCQS
jgi:hypothetical protein